MDKIYEQTMLFDFYGELLTEHQRSVYIDAVYNDLSLGEIAEERGISRQGVHDLIRRCDKILKGYEDKLHLVERFTRAKETVKEIQKLSGTGTDEDFSGEQVFRPESKRQTAVIPQTEEDLQGRLRRIGELSQELLEEL